jgi:REP element-mobilizing transposase RayT
MQYHDWHRPSNTGSALPYDPDIHHRRSIRLPGYDYSWAEAYFITLCTSHRECLFGEVDSQQIHLSQLGQIVDEEWHRSAHIRQEIELDAWVVMPNHVHGIVIITCPEGSSDVRPHATAAGASPKMGGKPKSLSSFVIGFKSASKIRINDVRGTPGQPLWQRNFYERVIRNDRELKATREYISLNPIRWALDDDNPERRR